MRSKSRPLAAKFLLVAFLAVGIFYNLLVFVYLDPNDLANVKTPVAIKVGKDVVNCFLVFLLCFPLIITSRFRPTSANAIHLIFPFSLGAMMWVVASINFDAIDQVTMGLIKNYTLYYSMAGLCYFVIEEMNLDRYFWKVFRSLMVISLLIGLALYFTVGRKTVFLSSGRMIATFGNPNFAGYFCAFYLVSLHLALFDRIKISPLFKFQFLLGYSCLLLTCSFSSILTYVLWLLLSFPFVFKETHPWMARVRNFMTKEIVAVALVGCVVTIVLSLGGAELFRDLKQYGDLLPIHKITSILDRGMDTFKVRIRDFSHFQDELFGDPKSVLLGVRGEVGASDGAFLNLARNFGIFLFGMWILYFLFPIGAALLKRTTNPESASRVSRGKLLAIFILCSLCCDFYLQVTPERYPSALFVGLALACVHFSVHHTPMASARYQNAV